MKQFIFWTGMLSLLAGAAFQFPALSSRLMPSEQPGMLMHVFGLMAMFQGVMLVFCARDLRNRGNLVAWEGILRGGGFAVMAGYGLFGDAGFLAVATGVFDLLIGIVYLVGLPRHLGIPLSDLLLDRNQIGALGVKHG
jgi:hypothetical protein